MDLLQQVKANKGTTGGKTKWTLIEKLYMLKLKNGGSSNKEIGVIIGNRSELAVAHQLRQAAKFATVQEMFVAHGAEFISNEDVFAKIEAYENELAEQAEAVS